LEDAGYSSCSSASSKKKEEEYGHSLEDAGYSLEELLTFSLSESAKKKEEESKYSSEEFKGASIPKRDVDICCKRILLTFTKGAYIEFDAGFLDLFKKSVSVIKNGTKGTKASLLRAKQRS
jgi:hypothetical protein